MQGHHFNIRESSYFKLLFINQQTPKFYGFFGCLPLAKISNLLGTENLIEAEVSVGRQWSWKTPFSSIYGW